MKIFNIFFKYWLPVFAWAGLIFYFSSLPNLKSSFEPSLDYILRKTAHLLEFGILAVSLLRLGLRKEQEKNKKFVYLGAILFGLLYAIIDEYHQGFVLGREATVRDVLIDGMGIVSISGLYLLRK